MTTLSEHQGDAVRTVVSRLKGAHPEPLTYIGGYAGTGKSTILPHILTDLGFEPQTVAFVAPTGKAAKIMRNKLKAQGYPNSIATTIHSAIYRAKPAPVSQLENDLFAKQSERQQAIADGSASRHQIEQLTKAIERLEADLANLYVEDKINFQLNVDSPIKLASIIVVDEASMVGEGMANDLMSFDVPVLAMGDPGQLPPVQDKPGLTRGRPDFFLTEIHRQAAGNPIIQLATLARQGKDLPLGQHKDSEGIVRAEVMHRNDYDPEPMLAAARASLNGIEPEAVPQVLCGTNRTRWRLTRMFREGLPPGPTCGEPLIVRKNSKEHPALVNGALATCLTEAVHLEPGKVTTQMSFEDEDGATYTDKTVFQGLFEEHYSTKKNSFSSDSRSAYKAKMRSIQLDFGWVLTVHNYQGSQADHVVLVDESSVFREDADKHLYTGVTRAAETLKVLV